ncbi:MULTISPECIES: hypothetical protein [Burkholderia]|nr:MULTISPECIES: hypothetical protein [Burkholderia]MDP9544180.1 hypothetical protein [Burkholderia cepacia]MBR8471900.1 hypothetical protein [Burkholderia cenocepacia]MBR8487722.1 hypothetical protein [Burkholderia cenocepacia]MDO5917463.1 hypothetical protein [Burkholderia cenocepacia]MDP9594171.1 hypothetical protein [Burkholderia cepacia]
MTIGNENSPLTRNASGQENGTEIEARGLSSAVNGTQTENLTSRKSPAPEQASEATAARPSMEDSTAEGIVDARTAGGNETSSKVSRADALTDRIVEAALKHLRPFSSDSAKAALKDSIKGILATSPASQPAAAPTIEQRLSSETQSGHYWMSSDDRWYVIQVRDGHYRHCGASADIPLRDAQAFSIRPIQEPNAAPAPADERAAFEAWLRSQGSSEDNLERWVRNTDQYSSQVVQAAWEGWTARASSANETGAEGVRAWETDDGRVISDAQKQQALRDGGASASSVRPFYIALGKISAAQAAEPVGEIVTFGPELKEVSWRAGKMPEIGTKLYAVPQPPAQVSGIIEAIAAQWDGCTYASPGEDIDIGTAIRTAWKRLTGSSTQADARIDVEAMLRACVPGGNICDPQRIADSIREWFNERGAREGAREGLTDSERNAIERAISEVELCCQFSLASELRALLAAHPDQPTARADDWIRVDVQRPIDAGIAPDDDVLAWNNDPGFPTIVEASFVTLSFPEYTHWKAKPKGPADTAQTGDAS